jgi:hypothetical protein
MSTTNAAAQIKETLAAFHGAGEVFEIRIPKSRQKTVTGYFTDQEAAAAAVAEWDGKCEGIYMTVNPINPALLARAANRLVPYAANTTADHDVLSRRWFLIDFDPAGLRGSRRQRSNTAPRSSGRKRAATCCVNGSSWWLFQWSSWTRWQPRDKLGGRRAAGPRWSRATAAAPSTSTNGSRATVSPSRCAAPGRAAESGSSACARGIRSIRTGRLFWSSSRAVPLPQLPSQRPRGIQLDRLAEPVRASMARAARWTRCRQS